MNKLSLQERIDLYNLISSIKSQKTDQKIIMLNDSPSDYVTDVMDMIKVNGDIKLQELKILINESIKEFESHQLKVKCDLDSLENALRKIADDCLVPITNNRDFYLLKERKPFLFFVLDKVNALKYTTLTNAKNVERSHLNDLLGEEKTDELLVILFYCEALLTDKSKTLISSLTYRDIAFTKCYCEFLTDAIVSISNVINEFRDYKLEAARQIQTKIAVIDSYNEFVKRESTEQESTYDYLQLEFSFEIFKKCEREEVIIDE